ncbi:hypothetical protein B9G98_01002 [Wickerhamiella sorbophila]|uniref:Uncharacterized protein n=1 Tax=Wickerhamiella sorbophila TaxID=45607 RepID=A0A2T0FEF6_9ASCO|nr:hypothetical protein B9G98_01002 [Wickerhamiella sorbophila]PRT53382.1 hypothetical protein B9G98_01002 [Wickerhamiella sorbophila]
MKTSIIATSFLAAVAIAAPAETCITSASPQNLNDPLLSSIEAVKPPLSKLISLVGAFQSQDGLFGALDIQMSYYPLYSSVMSLGSAAKYHAAISPNNVVTYLNALNTLVAGISTLLNNLNEKANLFQGVGVGSIVVGDITSLAGPASAIESNLFTAIPANAPCDQVAVAASVASQFSSAFAGASKVYKISNGIPSFPVAPTNCAAYC